MNHSWREELGLPPREIFPGEMPRYPNLWFLVDPGLIPRPKYLDAVRWLVSLLERELDLRDTFIQDIENPSLRRYLERPGEGSDFQARIGPLQQHVAPHGPGRSHWHQLHARFYISPLITAGLTRRGDQFLVPASIHYEVATEDPLHPYADDCPLCGITGVYEVPVDRSTQDYCVKIHDPLGLEFLLHGTVRGQIVAADQGHPVRSLQDLRCKITQLEPEDTEPVRLAVVTFDESVQRKMA